MRRYFLNLSYRGAPFHGWQTQPGAVTVQQTLEEALEKVLGISVALTGAGRTDAGVNARLMTAHFDLPDDRPLEDYDRFLAGLNALAGRDIAVSGVREVSPDLHARFSATSRTYHYYALPEKSAFCYPLVWKAPATLDYEAMNRAAAMLTEVDDFTSFAKLHSDAKTNLCNVTHARWEPWRTTEGTEGMVFVITANRFLRNMVRAVVGTLVEVGRGKMTVEGFRRVVEMRDRCAAGTSMPPQALFLWDITYPE